MGYEKITPTPEKPIFGTTIYIGSMPLDTEFGPFTCHTYQNLIHKGYVLALVYGDLKTNELHTRIHSSCVTSETLRSMDCDCVHQLNGALQKISQTGNGVLFYLIQEGRGCGFVGKSRACMMVQYHDDKITTFDAYKELGMKDDYRDYRNIWEVTKLLNISKKDFILLTNNPDKIKGFQEIGLKLKDVQSIEVAPSAFNQSYLISKQQTGHVLYQAKLKTTKYKFPHKRIKPFTPYSLPEASRYVHCSSYYLPIMPIDNQMIFSDSEIISLDEKNIRYEIIEKLASGQSFLKLNKDDLNLISIQPYWFRVNMYYDLASGCDYVILTYGDLTNRLPYVRVHSESLMNRFPLKEVPYKDKYNKSIEAIVRNESGAIVLLYHDGRGSGLGNYVLNQTQDQFKTGISVDNRDYKAVAQLLSKYIPKRQANVLYSSSSRVNLKTALDSHGFEIKKWIQIRHKDEKKGHQIIAQRIQDAPYYLFNIDPKSFTFNLQYSYVVTGVGSSEAHARYFVNLTETFHPQVRIRFSALTAFSKEKSNDEIVILISQGISPNVIGVIEYCNYKDLVILTSVTEKNSNPQKQEMLKRILSNGCQVFNYPLEDEYSTLIRTVGPLAGFYLIYKMLCPQKDGTIEAGKKLYSSLSITDKKLPDGSFFKSLKQSTPIIILTSEPTLAYIKNLVNKLEEGAFFSSIRCADYLEFAHGIFQNMEYQRSIGVKAQFILIKNSHLDDNLIDLVNRMLEGQYATWQITTSLSTHLKILELEMIFNHFILHCIKTMKIDQIKWQGQEQQKHLYDWHYGELKDIKSNSWQETGAI